MIKALIFLIIFFLVFFVYSVLMKSKKFSFKFLILILMILSLSLILAFLILENDKVEKFYFPPKFDGEKIVPGYFDEKN